MYPGNISQVLIDAFKNDPNPSVERLNELTRETGLQPKKLRQWFSQRRRKGLPKCLGRTEAQTKCLLEAWHQHGSNPSESVYLEVALQCGLTRKQVVRWFQYQRQLRNRQIVKSKLQQQDKVVKSKIKYAGNKTDNSNSTNEGTIHRYSQEETKVLMENFSRCEIPSGEDIASLAAQLNISEDKVKKWFSNRRYRLIHPQRSKSAASNTSNNNDINGEENDDEDENHNEDEPEARKLVIHDLSRTSNPNNQKTNAISVTPCPVTFPIDDFFGRLNHTLTSQSHRLTRSLSQSISQSLSQTLGDFLQASSLENQKTLMSAMQTESVKILSEVKTQITSVDRSICLTNRTVANHHSQLGNLQSKVVAVDASIAGQQAQIDQLAHIVGQLQKRIELVHLER